MTNKELSQKIRKDLKNAGIAKSAYGISVKYAGYEQCVNINIKDLSVSKRKIKDIVEKYEKIRRDCFGEILEGCNLFISVQYDFWILHEEGKKYVDKINEVIAECLADEKQEGHVLARKGNKELVLFYYGNDYLDNNMVVYENGESMQLEYGRYSAYCNEVIGYGMALFNALGKFN